jgi:hypothetical protein
MWRYDFYNGRAGLGRKLDPNSRLDLLGGNIEMRATGDREL